MRWGSAASTDKAYAYAYDRVGQLRSADYKLLSGGVWSPSANYQESGLTYDLNGNILSVQRTDGNGENLHELTYTYDGYRLLSVGVNGTASDSYLYDADGNMTFDGRRGLTITYNTLNLPEEIVAGNQKISYIYSASGEKLACDANGSLTYYRSVMVYGSDNKLLYMLTPEGTVSRTEGSAGTSYTYNYFKTDHLGSTRVMLSAVDGTLQTSQTTDFYPFGLAFEYSNLNKNRYLFSGKELQDGNLGGSMLEWYDFGARFYDPVLGRWFNVDPAAQVANPYLFCGNAPMMYVDKDGRIFWMIPAIAIGAASYTLSVALSPGGFDNWNWGWFFQSIGIGAVSGAVTSGIGKIFGDIGKFGTEVARGLTHGVAQGGLSVLGGDDFLNGFASGVLGSWAGSAFQLWKGVGDTGLGLYAMGGLSGGLGALTTGGNFWEGMGQGMIITGLNHAAWHEVARLKGELPNYSGKPMEDGNMGGCVLATLKSILEYMGLNELADKISIKPVGTSLDKIAEDYGFTLKKIKLKEIIQQIQGDTPVAMEYIPVTSTGRDHAVAIQAIEVRNGKYRLQVMDPDFGKIKPLYLREIRGANYRIVEQ